MEGQKSKAAILMLAAPSKPLLLPAPAAEAPEVQAARAGMARIADWLASNAESRKFCFLMAEARLDKFIELAAAFTSQERAAYEAQRIVATIKESAPATPTPPTTSRSPRRV